MDNAAKINSILSDGIQQFIFEHEDSDEVALLLKKQNVLGVPTPIVVEQIIGRRKAKRKLSFLYNSPGIIYPGKINVEQCSSEAAAAYKSNLFKGDTLVDLTGGFGIDSYFFSKRFNKVIYVERNESLVEIVRHNHRMLGVNNIEHHCIDVESFLSKTSSTFDMIYLDPSRRSLSNKKVYKFDECSPNVIALMPILLSHAKSVLLKASPLIDLQKGLKELKQVSKVSVIGINNECKEVLFLIDKPTSNAEIEAVNLLPDKTEHQSFSFSLAQEKSAVVNFSEPLKYLYEPNASLLKAGAFKLISSTFNLAKIASNTHLYTSDKFLGSFPGRIFEIEQFLKSAKASIERVLPEKQANILVRNYPLTPDQVKKKLNLMDGGEKFVIGFSGRGAKYLTLARRIK